MHTFTLRRLTLRHVSLLAFGSRHIIRLRSYITRLLLTSHYPPTQLHYPPSVYLHGVRGKKKQLYNAHFFT